MIIIGIVVGAGAGIAATTTVLRNKLLSKSQQVLKDAEEKGEVIKKDKILQAKEKYLQMKSEYDKQVSERNGKIQAAEQKLKQREQTLAQKVEELQKKSNELKSASDNLNNQIEVLNKRKAETEKIYKQSVEKLEHIAGMTADEAKQHLVEMMTDDAKAEASNTIMDIVEEAKMTANEQAKKIVIESIQRTATEHAIENTVSVFNLENEEVKGRIIGREGRNIRTLESLTGIEVIIDDSPDAIILSGFDPIRREIARLSLHKLVTDGRIHPARIEEVVAKTRKQIEQEIVEVGKRTCIDLGINNMNHELMRMVGRMKYRSSYGTTQGILEKEKRHKGDKDFYVQPEILSLLQGDFGRLADENGEMRVCFITDNDITGGNSGSAMFNGNGELLGLAFDGNWEAMSSDLQYEPHLQRCIGVDVRYMLFIIEHYGNAKHIVEEMMFGSDK